MANRRARSPAVEVMRLETLGRLAVDRDDLALARDLVGQALAVARQAGLAFWEAKKRASSRLSSAGPADSTWRRCTSETRCSATATSVTAQE